MQTDNANSLARQAFDLTKTELLVHLRFMSTAFSRLSLMPLQGSTLATNSVFIRFDASDILRLYAKEPNALTRAYLHIVMHNVFLHLFPGEHIHTLHWDTACDLAVEHAISELDLPITKTSNDAHQQAIFARINAELPLITAETLYRYLIDQNLSDEELHELRAPFYVDDHQPWHSRTVAEQEQTNAPSAGQAHEDPDDTTLHAGDGKEADQDGTDIDLPDDAASAKKSHASHQGMDSDDIQQKEAPKNAARSIGERFADTVNLDRSRDQWETAALEMGIQLDSYIKLWGNKGSNLSMTLKSVTRQRQDYREFLRKFARMGEQIHVNDDEFDYVYYCYGLKRYGNLPLIEPLEYVEQKRIRDFVIAIDTSASTKNGLVRRFVEKTYSILSEETSFFADMNVLIIQCDAEIADVTRISSIADLEDYVLDTEIKGLGGTDFRPVFNYVDSALERGDLTNLGGLIYFTDGQGTYPTQKPAYDTAFVFIDNITATASPPIPPWAIKVALDDTFILDEEL